MDWQRTILLAAIAAVTFMLFIEWNAFQEKQLPPVETASTLPSSTTAPSIPTQSQDLSTPSDGDIPAVPEESVPEPVAVTAQLISVETDNFEILIDTHGGDIVKVSLLKHLESLDNENEPFNLLNRTKHHIYIAQSGLIGPNGTDTQQGRPVFRTSRTEYKMASDDDTLHVDLTLSQDAVSITKRFTFHRNDYLIEMEYLVSNQSQSEWKANLFGQIKRDSFAPVVSAGIGVSPFLGPALSTPEENYKKFYFDDVAEEQFKVTKEGGWVAMVQHYFLSAWIPDQQFKNSFRLRKISGKDQYLFSFTSPQVEVPAGQQDSLKASFYVGPKDIYRLEEISPYLDLTVDYGWLWWIAKPLFRFLNWIYSFVNSWGWSIIILTIIVKAIFFPLSAASYRSMAKMRKVQPLMMDLKERYGDNRQKMSEELMKLYRKEKVNPLGGCLPILVQMPVFIALYWVLLESVELRHTPFLGWISDLSVKDPLFILPIIMGVTMFIQQKLNPTPPDPTQAKIMQMMPFIFTFMFMWFPAGLVLYWVVNNSLSIAQQYVITKQIEAAG